MTFYLDSVKAEKEQKKLIICADDFGYSPGVNKGIIKTLKKGVVSTAGVMINSSFLKPVLTFYQQNPVYDLGLHLTLNLSEKRPLLDQLREQVIKFERLFKQKPSHLSVHCPKKKADFLKKAGSKIGFCLKIISKKYQLYIRGEKSRKSFSFRAVKDVEQTKEAFKNIIGRLTKGINEMIVHPGEQNDSELNSSYSAFLRQMETKVLTSKEMIEILKREKIRLCNYKIFY